jgi:hypothetical protein
VPHCLRLPYPSEIWNSVYLHRRRVEDLLERTEGERTPALFMRPKGVQRSAWDKVLAEVQRRQTERDG